MARTVIYWGSTVIASLMLLTALMYLTGSPEVVQGFAKAGYPQYLRIVLGFVKPAAAIVLLAPGIPLLKEWAYAGATFTWIMASISAYHSEEGPIWIMPLVLLALLLVSYFTRPASRRLTA
jgi:DoxX-like family